MKKSKGFLHIFPQKRRKNQKIGENPPACPLKPAKRSGSVHAADICAVLK
jgi:hypothetical protein